MRLKIRKISTAELLVMFFMFVLSGAMYTLPTTSYTNSKLLSVAVVFVFMFFLKGKIKLKGTYSRYISDRVWFGCKCIVLKGSEILRDTVIAAGSIVSGKQTVHS